MTKYSKWRQDFIEEIIKDKNNENKNLRGKFGEFCKTTCHPHILRFSIHYRWFCDGEGCSEESGLKETPNYNCECECCDFFLCENCVEKYLVPS